MTFRELQDFCNRLDDYQLNQIVTFWTEDADYRVKENILTETYVDLGEGYLEPISGINISEDEEYICREFPMGTPILEVEY